MLWRAGKRWDRRKIVLAGMLTAFAGSCGHAPPPIRIDAGGQGTRGSDDQPWVADRYYVGGITFSTEHDISQTKEPAIYKTVRFGNSFRYSIPAPNGAAKVRLLFAEIYFDAAGRRVFNVSINKKQVLTNFDPFAEAGGQFRAVEKEFDIDVTDGRITILFTPITEDPMINAIEVVPKRI